MLNSMTGQELYLEYAGWAYQDKIRSGVVCGYFDTEGKSGLMVAIDWGLTGVRCDKSGWTIVTRINNPKGYVRITNSMMGNLTYKIPVEDVIKDLEEVTPYEEPEIKGLEESTGVNLITKAPDKTPLQTQEGGSHYKDLPIQPVEFAYKNNLPFIEGSVIEYVVGHRSKNGAQDIKKAIHFLQMLLELEYGEQL